MVYPPCHGPQLPSSHFRIWRLQVLMNLSEQAMALGAEKAQLMFMLQKRTSEMEHIIADRDARIQQARDASQLGQRAIQEVSLAAMLIACRFPLQKPMIIINLGLS